MTYSGRLYPLMEDLLRFLQEDAPYGDVTSEAVLPPVECHGEIIARESGIIAGLEEAGRLFGHFGLRVKNRIRDGGRADKGSVLCEVYGDARAILLVERTALNIIGRMSGIATATRAMVDAVSAVNSSVRIAATRKTAPGLRILDKKAVALGGGDTHRFGLSDGILIKDNHLALISLDEAMTRAKRSSRYRWIGVEVETVDQALKAAHLGADILLLDNMSPAAARQCVEALERAGLRDLVVEVSGGITLENVAEYAATGVDVISVGALTHSVRSLDLSLEIRRGMKRVAL
ncbi:MAG: carboxylating nicotinate-nucleotide diphosphorylase [Methanoculleaceae archaeon]